MLLQFSAKNYACFKDEVALSLVASNADKKSLKNSNIHELPKFGLRLLKSAAIYGANASGKSKLFDAIEFMKKFVLNSAKESQVKDPIPYNPFRLHTDTEAAPMEFEIVFVHEGVMYRYGFEATQKKIVSEWLYRRTKIKEVELFIRNSQDIWHHKTQFKVKDLVDNSRIRPNALMLSVAANWNNPVATTILKWFWSINILIAKDEDDFQGFTMEELENGKKKDIVNFLRAGGIDISNISILKAKASDLSMPDFMRKVFREDDIVDIDILFTHKKYGKEKDIVNQISLFDDPSIHNSEDPNNLLVGSESFSLGDDESSGTKQLFALAGPILDTLRTGKILLVDELESKLHPKLTKMIVGLFNSEETNPIGGQLVFNTHNTNMLDLNFLRRDQIWLVDKDKYGASSLYSLSDIKGVRMDDNIRKKYMTGKFGGTPTISSSRVKEMIFNNF